MMAKQTNRIYTFRRFMSSFLLMNKRHKSDVVMNLDKSIGVEYSVTRVILPYSLESL